MTDSTSRWHERFQNPTRVRTLVSALSTILTVVACVTCLRIEALNNVLGGVLPRHEVDGQATKFRATSTRVFREAMESRLRQDRLEHLDECEHFTDTQLQSILRSPLTRSEKAALDESCRQNEWNTSLLAWVSTMGLLQYIILPIALGSTLWCIAHVRTTGERIYLCGLLALCVLCVVMLFHRAYFASLGW